MSENKFEKSLSPIFKWLLKMRLFIVLSTLERAASCFL